MASAHVAGTSALYLSAYLDATPAHVRSGLQDSASLYCVGDPKGIPNVLLFSDLSQGNDYCGLTEKRMPGPW